VFGRLYRPFRTAACLLRYFKVSYFLLTGLIPLQAHFVLSWVSQNENFTSRNIHTYIPWAIFLVGDADCFAEGFETDSFYSTSLAFPCLSVGLSVCNSSRTNEQIFLKFGSSILYALLIRTRSYGLDCTLIDSRWGRNFPHLPRPALGRTQYRVSFLGVKRPWHGVDHPLPFNT
jgi:hypothetical protein